MRTGIRLETLGWNERLARDSATSGSTEGLVPARVAAPHRRTYTLFCERGEIEGILSGKLRDALGSAAERPAVGDWVLAKPLPNEHRAVIHRILPRASVLSRKSAGEKTEEQVIAANIDTVFLVSGLDGDFNLARIQRYLFLARESGARPIVVLNKADLVEDPVSFEEKVETVAGGAPVVRTSAERREGLEKLLAHLGEGKTGALIGSSGVGKSTLVNRLVGSEILEVRPVRRERSRGRHTTTRRELIVLGKEGLLIDTPGLREIQLWADGETLEDAFEDIAGLAESCRFRDCGHRTEPGCAVLAALEEGTLDERRYEAYAKMRKELDHLRVKRESLAHLAGKKRWKDIAKMRKAIKKRKG
jgi:ribosome biogenesis GTPase